MIRRTGTRLHVRAFLSLGAIALFLAGCGDRGADPDSEAPDSVLVEPQVPGIRGYPATDSGPPPGTVGGEDTPGEKVAVTVRDGSITLSTDSIGAGPATFVIENRGQAAHTIEVRSEHYGRWTTIPIRPTVTVTLRMSLTYADYEVFCLVEDVSGVHRENGERAVVRVR